jgi:sulfide:quinone oxidoreductase
MATSTLILGGGFGGIATANTLRRLLPPEHAVTVVDHSPRFHVGAGKTWVMLGTHTEADISQSRAALLERGVTLDTSTLEKIDLRERYVLTSRGALRWDHLVIALGANPNLGAIPGLAGAHSFYSLADATRLQRTLAEFQGGEVVVLIPRTPFKCPPAPYEAALLLQEFFADRGLAGAVRLTLCTVEGTPMATAGPEMGAFIRGELAARGITFLSQRTTSRVDPVTRRVEFSEGGSLPYDLLIAVPPHQAPAVLRETSLLNPAGWIPVDSRTLEVKHPEADGRVFAVGDVTSVGLPGRFKPDVPLVLPKAGVMAASHGIVVGRRIAARVLGTAPDAEFDGQGFCYLETGGGLAVKADGSFFALPHPVMHKQPTSAAQFSDKLAWVRQHLTPICR